MYDPLVGNCGHEPYHLGLLRYPRARQIGVVAEGHLGGRPEKKKDEAERDKGTLQVIRARSKPTASVPGIDSEEQLENLGPVPVLQVTIPSRRIECDQNADLR